MWSRAVAIKQYISNLSYVIVTLNDGSVIEGNLEMVCADYFIVDEVCAFGDMVIVRYNDVFGIAGR